MVIWPLGALTTGRMRREMQREVPDTVNTVKKWLPVVLALLASVPAGAMLAFLLFVRSLKKAGPQPIAAPYRGGSVGVTPGAVTAGGPPVPVRISYTVGADGIETGGGLRLCPGKVLRFGPDRWRLCLQWANGWGQLQRSHPGRLNHLDVSTSRKDVELAVSMLDRAVDRTRLPWLKRKFLQKVGIEPEPFDPRDTFIEAQKVAVTVERGRLERGDTIDFTLGAVAGLETPYAAMETDFALEVDPHGSGRFVLESAVPAIKATGGDPGTLEVVAPSTAAPGERIPVLVRCLDSRGVLTPRFAGRLTLFSTGEIAVPPSVLMTGDGDGVAWFQAVVTGRGIARIRARDGSGRLEGESNPVVCSDSVFRLLWGDLHTHSLVSDGTMEPGYHYYRARYLLGRDFAAVSDHDTWSLAEEHERLPEEFELMVRAAEENYRPGEFVTFPAYEWTNHRLGHRVVLFGPGEEPVLLSSCDERYGTPGGLLAALAGKNVMVIPHHPAWKTHYGEMRFEVGSGSGAEGLQRLVEVYSTHGSSEYYGTPCPLTHAALIEGFKGRVIRAFLGKEFAGRKSGSYVRDLLAAGHRFALVAGSDDHLVGADPHRGIGIVYGGGLAGAYARARTRESVWDALMDRRVCATTGPRMVIDLRVNGTPPGSELLADGPPHITGHVVGTAGVDYVQVVKFDGDYSVAWEVEGDGREVVVDFTDRRFNRDSFYYLRAVQADGHMAWAGPTWVDHGVVRAPFFAKVAKVPDPNAKTHSPGPGPFC